MTDLRRAARAAKPHPQTVRVPTLSFLRWIALALTAGAIVISGVYLWQMGRAYDRIAGQSQVIDMGDERIERVFQIFRGALIGGNLNTVKQGLGAVFVEGRKGDHRREVVGGGTAEMASSMSSACSCACRLLDPVAGLALSLRPA